MSQETSTTMNPIFNASRQERCFNAFMQIYNDKAYGSMEHRGWVHDMLRQHPELCQTTLIYHHEDENPGHYDATSESWIYGSDDKIRDNLMYPIPVYWGGDGRANQYFDWRKVKTGLGYSENNAYKIPEELRATIRYAIVGPVKVKEYQDLPQRDAFVIHTEGVNLESTQTAVYKSIFTVGRSRKEILNDYFTRHRAMLKLIIEAAMSQIGEGERAWIQAPMIGAGCFLRGVEKTGIPVEAFLQCQVKAMQSVLNMAPLEYNFVYKLCIFNTTEFSNDIVSAYQKMEKINTRFVLGMDKDGGNVLVNVPYGMPNRKEFIVNAGDSRSFIGNGMNNDPTVEGFIVANARGYNPQWQNTSFLHNPYFNPDIFRPVESALQGRQVWKATMEW
jgi:hypothetical protein